MTDSEQQIDYDLEKKVTLNLQFKAWGDAHKLQQALTLDLVERYCGWGEYKPKPSVRPVLAGGRAMCSMMIPQPGDRTGENAQPCGNRADLITENFGPLCEGCAREYAS